MPFINQVKKVQVNAKELRIHIKVRDRFQTEVVDQDGQHIAQYEGYVPDFMPGEHYGDYLILNIDVDTGQILNWKSPTGEEIEEMLKAED